MKLQKRYNTLSDVRQSQEIKDLVTELQKGEIENYIIESQSGKFYKLSEDLSRLVEISTNSEPNPFLKTVCEPIAEVGIISIEVEQQDTLPNKDDKEVCYMNELEEIFNMLKNYCDTAIIELRILFDNIYTDVEKKFELKLENAKAEAKAELLKKLEM